LRASLVRLTPHVAVFEVYNPGLVLQTSEVLDNFKILFNESAAYSGRAVVSSVVGTGSMLLCEVRLDEAGFLIPSFAAGNGHVPLGGGFSAFLSSWQRTYKVLPEFKVVVADMQTFLLDLRLWLDQVELEVRSAPAGSRLELERRALDEVGPRVVSAFDAMHERLEGLSGGIDEELRPAHQSFCRRQLHPVMLCSPFAYRTYHKPLGYAGDYEMVNMIARDPREGGSLYAKAVNLWFLSQWPARAHRNRIAYLQNLLAEESARVARLARPLRVLNLGCGPALEIQGFLAADPHSDTAQFTLLDFNEETIRHAATVLEEHQRRHGRRAAIQVQKKSVQHVLKEGSKPVVGAGKNRYDLVYCAGLFDYLPDRTCRQLMNIFHDWTEPGGLVVATNVDDSRPFRHMLEFVLDWHLIYRNESKAAALLPEAAAPETLTIRKDPTGVNLFVEVRKPGDD
jgi:extracellular factor (EF) 3-hydroxypalmitic acid methyl ester biosynthesis protein